MINYFNFKRFYSDYLLTNDFGRYIFLKPEHFYSLVTNSQTNDDMLNSQLQKRGFIYTQSDEAFSEAVSKDIFYSKHYLYEATQLHIFVVTTACNLKCVYCQAQNGCHINNGYMTEEIAKSAVDIALQSPAKYLQFEFQGGEPLLNFDIIKFIVLYSRKKASGKNIKYSIVTNLTLINDDILDFIVENNIEISTSLDGDELTHNLNRAYKNGEGTYKDVVSAIKRVKNRNVQIGAILTVSKTSLKRAKEIVDEYVSNGLSSISLRPLTPLGCARENWNEIGYSADEFIDFYTNAFDYIIENNINGNSIAESISSVFLKKIIDGIAINHMEYRSPCGASIGQMAYYYDGNIYTCDEGRMIFEMGDASFKLGNVHVDNYDLLMDSRRCKGICSSSILESLPSCSDCVYQPYCGVCPAINYMLYGDIYEKTPNNYKCKINKGILDLIFKKLQDNNYQVEQVFRSWIE